MSNTPNEPVVDEATAEPVADGAAELKREQQAQEFDLPDATVDPGPPPLQFDQQPLAPSPYGGNVIDEPARHQRQAGTHARTLEDLYVLYPKIGHGDWKLRVERTSPASFRGCATAGFLGEFYERISMEEFRDKFGGGRYTVKVLKPVNNAATRSDYQFVNDVKFRLPGDPTLEGIPSATNAEDDAVSNRYDPRAYGLPSEKVEIARLQHSRDRERDAVEDRRRIEGRLEQERLAGGQKGRGDIDHYAATYDRAWEDVKEQNATQLTFWQQEVERLRATLAVIEAELKEVRSQLARAESDAANTSRNIETASMREMRERHEERHQELKDTSGRANSELKERNDEERRRMMDEHQRKTEEASTDHRRQIDEITRRHDDARTSFESAQSMERERQREDARNRIDQIERAKELEVRQLRETQESRLDDLRRSTEREITSLREQSSREVTSVRESQGIQATMIKETAGGKVDLANSELNRLRAENGQLRSEMESLRTQSQARIDDMQHQLHKPFQQALQEAKETAGLVGMVDASEAAAAAGGEPETLAQQIIGFGKETLPKIFDQIAETRQKNQQAALAQIHAQQQQRMLPQAQAPAPQQVQPQPQQQVPQGPRYPAPGQGGYASAPMGSASPVVAAPVPMGPPSFNMGSPIQPANTTAAQGTATPMGIVADEQPEGAAVPLTDVPVAPPPQAAPQQAAPAAQESGPGLPPDAITTFFTELDAAIAGKLVSPVMFADGIIERIGAPATAQLLQRYQGEDVVNTARQISNESAILTRHGRRFVEELWVVAGQKVGGAAAA